MSYDDYTPAPSGSLARSSSIDYTNPDEYETQTTGPGYSSLGIREREYHFPTDGQRTVKPVEVVNLPPPQTDEVRPGVNSSNLITGETGNRGLDPNGYDDQRPYSFQDVGRKNNSGYNVGDVSSNEPPPSHSAFAQRERSNNGTAAAGTESLDPLDYVGISLVGRRFKMVNPEAYYVEKDNDLTGFPAPY